MPNANWRRKSVDGGGREDRLARAWQSSCGPTADILAMVGGVGDDVSGRGTNRSKRTDNLIARPHGIDVQTLRLSGGAGARSETGLSDRRRTGRDTGCVG